MPFLPFDRSQLSTNPQPRSPLSSSPTLSLTAPDSPGLPPYALAPAVFRFRGLIALAERLPIGGEREVVLAAFLAARLAWDGASEDFAESQLQRARAAHARTWLGTLALGNSVKGAFQLLFDALASGDRSQLVSAWDRVSVATNKVLDSAARGDIKSVTARLARAAQGNQ